MKAKFYCLCMSPAIDATVTLKSAPKGEDEVFKDVEEEENVGGKAVNVARWLAYRGAEVACGGLLGEDNDALFVKELAKYSIADRFIRVSGSTRRNEMIVWPGGSMKLNRAAFPHLRPGEVEGADVLAKLADLEDLKARGRAGTGRIAVISGSLPPAVSKGFYAEAVAHFKSLGCIVVLDTSGAALVEGVKAFPDVIKPNAEECEALVGFVPKTPAEFAAATEKLRKTCAFPIISDGGSGCWFNGEFVAAPKVDVVDTTAAGDTLLAEWCWRKFGEQSADAERLAVEAGSAACTVKGTGLTDAHRFGIISRK